MTTRGTILLVEDDPNMRMGLEDNLRIEGYACASVTSAREARRAIRERQPDLVLLDRMLPDGDGVELCRHLRADGYRQPIIMLTAKGEEMDKVVGLESGADDYLVKPFSLRELLARINAGMRRSVAWRDTGAPVRVGAASVDFQRHTLQRDGLEIECSARELALLRYLVERRGQVVSRDTLLEVVWGRPQDVSTRTVDNFVVRLRRKIEADPAHPRVLLTVHGTGYKLVAD
jgi:DNA-binding response OmpR family regulator